MADPPWDINQRGNYGAINHYDLMSLERIKAIPVAGLCEDNSHLYLWCPNGLLPEALEVVKASLTNLILGLNTAAFALQLIV